MRPEARFSRAAASSPGLTTVSASAKIRKRPAEARAPALRAREIWLTGSKTTRAPSAAATSAVRSEELLSTTISSPARPDCSMAAQSAGRVRPSSASSL